MKIFKTQLKQGQETYRWPSFSVPAILFAGGAKFKTSSAAPTTEGGGRGGGCTTLLLEDLGGGGKGGKGDMGGPDAAMGWALDCKAAWSNLSWIACSRRALRVASLIWSTKSDGNDKSWLSPVPLSSSGSVFTANGSYSGDPGCFISTVSFCSSSHAIWSANMSNSVSPGSVSTAVEGASWPCRWGKAASAAS